MKSLVVTPKFNNKKLTIFLLSSFDGLSLNTIYKALRKKDIIVNSIRVKENITLYENDKVTIYIADDYLYKNFEIDIVYEDNNILIVNKPVGIEVISNTNSLLQILKSKYEYIEPCHRLDRNTTGLVLFAKNKQSLDILLNKIKNREIRKFYKCLVYGIPKVKSATLEAFLFKDTKKSLVYISNTFKKGYQKIITSYTVLKENKNNNTSILEVELHTGKTHQIRAHLAYINLPIIGDGKYGISSINKQFNKTTQELCAYKLIFDFKDNDSVLNYLNGKVVEI